MLLLVPLAQPGVTIRPIRQMTGVPEFNEVFFDDARTEARCTWGAPGAGWASRWRCSASSAACRRWPAGAVRARDADPARGGARQRGRWRRVVARAPLAQRASRCVIRFNALRVLAGTEGAREALIAKYAWSNWRRDFGVPGRRRTGRGRRPHRRRSGGADAAADLVRQPCRHHLRRCQRDPAQPDRRARLACRDDSNPERRDRGGRARLRAGLNAGRPRRRGRLCRRRQRRGPGRRARCRSAARPSAPLRAVRCRCRWWRSTWASPDPNVRSAFSVSLTGRQRDDHPADRHLPLRWQRTHRADAPSSAGQRQRRWTRRALWSGVDAAPSLRHALRWSHAGAGHPLAASRRRHGRFEKRAALARCSRRAPRPSGRCGWRRAEHHPVLASSRVP